MVLLILSETGFFIHGNFYVKKCEHIYKSAQIFSLLLDNGYCSQTSQNLQSIEKLKKVCQIVVLTIDYNSSSWYVLIYL